MDYYNFGSKPTAPLDLFHLPVRRELDCATEWVLRPPCRGQPKATQVAKDCRQSFAGQTQVPLAEKTTSSTSLILRRTTERETHKQYSVLSYTNLRHSYHHTRPVPPPKLKQFNKERPVIKVTVIPNSDSPINKSRKRRKPIKKLQNTVSNQESCFKGDNVYLVVTGRKKEKIYELKTAGSAELPNIVKRYSKDEDVGKLAIEKNLKDLIKSLNMDKNKKKGKNKKPKAEEEKQEPQEIILHGPVINEHMIGSNRDHKMLMPDCYCVQAGRNRMFSDQKDLRSRVKIFGRIGLDVDDKYVLNCAATVDDKPIETNIQGNFNGQNIERNTRTEHQTLKSGQRDFVMQADFRNDEGPTGVEFSSVATQCSASNFNSVCFSNIEKLHIMSNLNQTLHVASPQAPHNFNGLSYLNADFSDYESSSQTPFSCTNPVVIISVYPKHGTGEERPVQDPDQKRSSRDPKNKSPQPKSKVNPARRGPTQQDDNKSENRSVGSRGSPKGSASRSPSPGRASPKPKIEAKQAEWKGPKAKPGKGSPVTPRSSSSVNKQKILQKDKPSRDVSPKGPKLSSPNNSKPGPSKFQKQQSGQPMRKTQNQPVTSEYIKELKEEQALTKKAIVDAYTKKVTAQMNSRQPKGKPWVSAKNDSSNVTVNIDGENEFYNVMFHQYHDTTDLRVRKTLKNQASQKTYADADDGSASLENFFYMTGDQTDPRRRSFSQTLLLEDRGALDQSASRLSNIVRDSIEVCHRRECHSGSYNIGNSSHTSFFSNHSNKMDDHEFFAPIKHFKGDNCLLPDPVERDKEIRQLLGVTNRNPNIARHPEGPDIKNTSKLRCFFKLGKTNVAPENEDSSIIKLYQVDCECYEDYSTTPSEDTSNDHEYRAYQNKSDNDTYDDELSPYDAATPLYQQLILNRNINVYLEIEQFTKQKPIVLTRSQYQKVKSIIEYSSSNKKHGLKHYKKPSSVSVGEVRRKNAPKKLNYDHDSNQQSSKSPNKRKEKDDSSSSGGSKNQSSSDEKTRRVNERKHAKKHTSKHSSSTDSEDNTRKSKKHSRKHRSDTDEERRGMKQRTNRHDTDSERHLKKLDKHSRKPRPDSDEQHIDKHEEDSSEEHCRDSNKECKYKCCRHCGAAQAVTCCPRCGRYFLKRCVFCKQSSSFPRRGCSGARACYNCGFDESTELLFRNDKIGEQPRPSKHALSSTEILQYSTNVSYVKRVTFSTTNVQDMVVQVPPTTKASLLTIFRGHKKPPTPNLGTSVFSLYSEYSDAPSYKGPPEEKPRKPFLKPRKPFLKRLMSCLVMHSRPSQARLSPRPNHNVRTVNSSIDSYHISTSLAAVDIGSSLYDTSASFYTNHSVHPVTSKAIKKGFLSSVRGFLYRAT